MNFYELLKNNRIRLGLSYEDLVDLTGLSKQYLYNLENPNYTGNLSLDKLKKFVLILSLKDKEFLHLYKETTSKEGHEALLKYINLETFKEILFSATDLFEYENNFIPAENIVSSLCPINEYIKREGLENKPLKELNHTFEIWTLTDNLAEYLFEKSAEETAEHIIKHRIRYINFIPFNNNQWEIACRKIERYIRDILESDGKLKEYWLESDDDWKKYLVLYELPPLVFFNKFRIYNPNNPNDVSGNYNIGGKTINSMKLTDISYPELLMIIDKFRLIIELDKEGLIDSQSDSQSDNHYRPQLCCDIKKITYLDNKKE